MEQFSIITDSCSDLDRNTRERYGIEYLPMRILFEDRDLPASLDWEQISAAEFYRLMRDGVRIRTSQINAEEYREAFEKCVSEGRGVLSISCSSALSSSYRGSLVAREEVLKKYPDAQIFCIDSRNACMGLGILCMTAADMRAEGRTLSETAAYLEAHKQEVNQFCTVESLTYLKRAGRVSATSAVFGGLLQVKPIIISDVNGQNVAVEKVKGRRASFLRVAELFGEAYRRAPYQRICIVHADCEADAEALKELVLEKLPDRDVEVRTDLIGPIIGASTGPGTVAVYSYGKEVTFDGAKA